jgi:hypothetical protein
MNFLTPLYLAGALAVTLPVLFHLIRRTPRGEAPFSSLMFLSPSPPRITRRSRIEHWLLLALRALALVLLATAFSRPFWRQPAQAQTAAANQRRIAVLVDTSASMRRGDLWRQAVAAVDAALADVRPQDQVGVFGCDETLRPVASFEDLAQVDPARRRAVVTERMAALEPTWAGTHLGQSLLDAVALVNDSRDATEEAGRAERTIVLVSDLQSGSRANVLGDFPWPADVQLDLKRVAVANPTNAGLWRLADDAADDDRRDVARKGRLRVRVANAADSRAEEFRLQWHDAAGKAIGAAVDAYVPAGESRVVRVSPPKGAVDRPRLMLDGDAHDFDNTLYFTPKDRREFTILYLGDDAADDRQGLQYFLERAVTADAERDVAVADYAANDAVAATLDERPPLVVATSDPEADQVESLRTYVTEGGTLLTVLTSAEPTPGLAALLELDEPPEVTEADVADYALLTEIDFDHPLFAGMAGPKFNDFSQIRFWKHRRLDAVELPSARVVARFDDGDPAILEQRLGAGRVVVMTAGWQPSDGQLARSWKFLLMLSSLVDNNDAARGFRSDYLVNERVTLPERGLLADRATVERPDGSSFTVADDAESFTATDAPGMYALAGAAGEIPFVVNLDPNESDTAPLAPEALEQLGVRLAGAAAPPLEAERLQQLRDVELESRQRLWQWLAAAALAVLIVETWLAGRLSRPMEQQLAVS